MRIICKYLAQAAQELKTGMLFAKQAIMPNVTMIYHCFSGPAIYPLHHVCNHITSDLDGLLLTFSHLFNYSVIKIGPVAPTRQITDGPIHNSLPCVSNTLIFERKVSIPTKKPPVPICRAIRTYPVLRLLIALGLQSLALNPHLI